MTRMKKNGNITKTYKKNFYTGNYIVETKHATE